VGEKREAIMTEKAYGVICHFETPKQITDAAKKVREKGYARFETFTPFPVHNLDKAMGLKETRVAWFCLLGGITGCFTGFFLQWFANGFEMGFDKGTPFYMTGYQFIVSGKAPFDIIPSIPIIFELTVLLSVFGGLFGLACLCRLPAWYHPTFKSKAFNRVTDDRFFLVIEAVDSKYVKEQVMAFMESLGGQNIEELTA
jgi:hypothetical protein